jgi:uncharacterized surface protein with fasciclin (FAS1) repeats
MFRKLSLAAAFLAAGTGLAAAQGTNPTVGGAPMMANMTIAQNAGNAPNLTTLVAAVQAAGMVDTLMGPGPFTVFAPTNRAFQEINGQSLQRVLGNQAQLQQILGCHVVAAEAFSNDIVGMIRADGGAHPVQTVGGCTLTVYSEGGRIKLRDENGRVATVTTADVDQSNGVVHVIDRVLIPGGQVAMR